MQALIPQLVESLQTQASVILIREPLRDPHTPLHSDLDLIAFAETDELLPQRWRLPGAGADRPLVDLIWLPAKLLGRPEALAMQGVIPHRILSSRLIHDSSDTAAKHIGELAEAFQRPDIQRQRQLGLLQLGADAVREVGVTRDFPGQALFWLHMAAAALLSALADGAGLLCPNVYTRPFDHLDGVEAAYGRGLERELIALLHLEQPIAPMIERLQRIHQRLSKAFPEPDWPAQMRHCTRYEYRYFSAADELAWRIGVAEELAAGGKPWAAVFSLRFWAYMLACIPMVYQRAAEGIDVSFVRPQRAVRPDLERHCPQILDDLGFIYGESHGVDGAALEASVAAIRALRTRALDQLAARGLVLRDAAPWQPYQADKAQRRALNS